MPKRPPQKGPLTVQQQRFKNYILEGKTQYEAYKLAGFVCKNRKQADSSASNLMRQPVMKKALEAGKRQMAKRANVRADTVINEIKALAMGKITDIITWDETGKTKITPSEDLPDNVKAAIKRVKHRNTEYYKEGVKTHEVTDIEFEMHAKQGPLEKLGEYLNIWKGNDGDKNVINLFLTKIQNDYGMIDTDSQD